ncbi:MAG: PepSY-associated TM helix domain-containing protein [Spirosomataceae bacterium]
MRKFDKLVYSIHKWTGLLAGLFLLLISVTGTILVFRDEIDSALNSDLLFVEPADKRLTQTQLLQVIKEKYPTATLNGTALFTGQATRSTMMELEQDHQRSMVYLNPYTGQVLGSRLRNEIFVRKVLAIHEHLTLGKSGHLILFLVGLSFILSVVTGLWYYRKSLLSVFKIGVRTKNTYLLNADLHKWIGVSASLFLALMAATGTFMHWEKVERMLDEIGQEAPPPRPKEDNSLMVNEIAFPVDSLVAVASQAVAGFTPQFIAYPRHADEPLEVRGTRPESNRLLGVLTTSIAVDIASKTVKEIHHKEDGDLEQNMESAVEQLHFGDYGGLFTKIIYALGGLGLSVMTITGFVIWWKKR